jgi:hypothetical protein
VNFLRNFDFADTIDSMSDSGDCFIPITTSPLTLSCVVVQFTGMLHFLSFSFCCFFETIPHLATKQSNNENNENSESSILALLKGGTKTPNYLVKLWTDECEGIFSSLG